MVHETGPQYGKLLVGVAILLSVAAAGWVLRRRRPAAVAKSPPIH
jgi:LPXTG-motif cell wall-anchored protein